MREKAPKKIMLQWVGCDEIEDDGEEAFEVTWCADPIYDTDVAYVRTDVVKETHAKLLHCLRVVYDAFQGDEYDSLSEEAAGAIDIVDELIKEEIDFG